MTNPNWTYPEDVPAAAQSKHPDTLRTRFWRVMAALGLASSLMGCVTGQPLPQTADAYERPSAPLTLQGHAGGFIETAQRQVNRYFFHQVPVRLGAGHYTSAGTFWLFIVEHVPGSCIERDGTLFHFHGTTSAASILLPFPVRASGETRERGDRAIADAYNPALAAWFNSEIAPSDSASFQTLTGAQLIDEFGYAECWR